MRTLWVWPFLHLLVASLAPGQPDLLAWPAVFGLLAGSTAIAQLAAFGGRPGRYRVLSKLLGRGLVAVSGLIAVAAALYLNVEQPLAGGWRWLDAPLRDPLRSIPTLLAAVWLWWWGYWPDVTRSSTTPTRVTLLRAPLG